MASRRAHISLETKLAAALLALGHIPYLHAKQMTADQVISLYAFDHGILHSQDGTDDFWNLTPRGIIEHRRKTATIDVPQAAKSKRLIAAQKAINDYMNHGIKPPPPKRKIASRGFRPGHRPLRSRSSFERRAP